MTNNTKQHSQEWLEIKRSKIGSSEIFALCLNYCKKELEQVGINGETSFKTALEIFLEKKFNVEPDPISKVCSEFGLGMESFIVNRLNNENPNLRTTKTDDFIYNDDLPCCSPDSYVEIKEGYILDDFDKKNKIDSSWGKGIRELKTADFGFNFEAEKGVRWQYIFQHQFQLMVANLKWGSIDVLAPKEKEFDNDFFKGKVLGKLEMLNEIDDELGDISEKYKIDCDIDKYYNLYTYTYKANKTIQNICKLALNRFQKAMDDVKLPSLSENKDKLMREKKMLAKMYPAKYGSIKANEELNGLLNERGIINNQFTILKTELEQTNCKIIQKMDKAIEAKGFNYIAKFDKRHALRVSQNKDSDVTPKMVEQLQAGEFVDFTQGG